MVQSLLKKALAERRRVLYSIGVWTTKDGQEIHVSKIENGHLLNIYRFLEKLAWKKYSELVHSAWAYPEPFGDVAQDAYWGGMDELDDITPFDILRRHPFFHHLAVELTRRGKDVYSR